LEYWSSGAPHGLTCVEILKQLASAATLLQRKMIRDGNPAMRLSLRAELRRTPTRRARLKPVESLRKSSASDISGTNRRGFVSRVKPARRQRPTCECRLGLPSGQNRSELLLGDGVCARGNARESYQTLRPAWVGRSPLGDVNRPCSVQELPFTDDQGVEDLEPFSANTKIVVHNL
jgi:hypothetical protein